MKLPPIAATNEAASTDDKAACSGVTIYMQGLKKGKVGCEPSWSRPKPGMEINHALMLSQHRVVDVLAILLLYKRVNTECHMAQH